VSDDIRSTQELLPWLMPLTDGIVACKDSSLLACFEFVGPDADSVSEGEMAQVGMAVDRMLLSLRDMPVTLWWTVRRERNTDYPGEPMPDPISQMLDDGHKRSILASASWTNRHFLSVLWMPERNSATLFNKVGMALAEGGNMVASIKTAIESTFFGKKSFAWKAAELEPVLDSFEQRLSQIGNMMDSLRPRRLRGNDLIGFLWAMSNPGSIQCPKAASGHASLGVPFLDAALSETPINVHRDTLQFGDIDPVWVNVLSMKSWPSPIAFGAFNALLALPTEMVISHCFRVMSQSAINSHIQSVRVSNELMQYPLLTRITSVATGRDPSPKSANPARQRAVLEAKEALGVLTGGDLIFGWHTFSITLLNRDRGALDTTFQDCKRMLDASPFVGAVRESLGLLSAWCTTLPGQWQEGKRWLTISSRNQTDIAPLSGVHEGERINEHLSGMLGRPCKALTVMGTDFNTPYWFNFHVGALGHAFVVGPSRTGKSIAMNFLISQFRKYGDDAEIVIFDKDYSCRIPTLLQGGEHMDLRDGSSIRLNPVLLAKDQANWGFLARWIEILVSSRGYKVTTQDAKAIYEAIKGVAAIPSPDMWRLYTIRSLLPKDLGEHLDAWVGEGQYANIFDNLEDGFSLSRFTCIEMGEIMKEPRVARAFLEYAFFRIQKRLEMQAMEGVKATMIYIEECWFLLKDEHFSARLEDWLKTFAKLNAFLVLTTQSIEDLATMSDTVFASIRDNIQCRIFLPNANAASEKLFEFYRRNFDLRPELIHRIATGIPKRDYLIVRPEVARKVHLLLNKRQIAALRSDIVARKTFEPIWTDRQPGWQTRYIQHMETLT